MNRSHYGRWECRRITGLMIDKAYQQKYGDDFV